MGESVRVFVSVRKIAPDRVELVLEAVGNACVWSKIYDGSLFMSMDAQSLGLLELVPESSGNGPHFRLKRDGEVQPEQLARMRFLQTTESDSGK